MSVYELERSFKNLFGLNVQVSRKAGMIWLETTKTDKWSLQKQKSTQFNDLRAFDFLILIRAETEGFEP